MSTRDAAVWAGTQGRSEVIEGNKRHSTTVRPELQWRRGVRALLLRPMTTRELAGPPVFAHAAHSLAAAIRRKGVGIDTEMVTIRGYGGSHVKIARYSIAPESRAFAEQLLAERQ